MNKLKLSNEIARIANSPSTDRRSDLVNEGSLLSLEKAGYDHNEARLLAHTDTIGFGSLFTRSADYQMAAAKWGDDVLYFCAEKVAPFMSVTPDRSRRDTFVRRELMVNPIYLNTLGGIVSEVMKAVTPAMISDIVGEMISVEMVPHGRTLEITTNSNAVFKWYDAGWSSLRSVPAYQLYNNCITLNPSPRACKFMVDYYQMTSGGTGVLDLVSAVTDGFAAKLMDAFTAAFLSAAGNTKYVPAALKATGYTDDNWAALIQHVAMANNCGRHDLVALGQFLALRHVMPSNATLGAAIMTPMGNKYFRDGYLMSHDGVMLHEMQPAVKPGTINSTLETVFPDDTIIIAARANARYAPMVIGFEEGGDASINLTPGDDVMATGRIEGIATTAFDIQPVFASKIGIMSAVA